MAFPRFSMKQLFTSVTLVAIGFGGIAFSRRDWNLSPGLETDWLATAQPIVRTTSLVVGWAIVCLGFIVLMATRRRMRVLAFVLLSTVPGLLIGAAVSQTFRPPNPALSGYQQADRRGRDPIPLIAAAVSSCITLLGFALTEKRTTESKQPPN